MRRRLLEFSVSDLESGVWMGWDGRIGSGRQWMFEE